MARRRTFATVAQLLLLGLALGARVASAQQPHPDLSGRWVLDSAHSEHSPLTPSVLEVTIQRTGDTLHVTSHAVRGTGEATAKTILDLAGRATRNVINQGGTEFAFTTTTAWAGDSLKVKTVGTPQGQEMTQNAIWTIGSDGNTLNYSLTVDIGGQHLATRMTLTRRPVGTDR